MIVGITGLNKAGKGTLVDILKDNGFSHFSVRGYLQDELGKMGLPKDNRQHMIDLANEIRLEHHPGYIVEQLHKQAAQTGGNCVIESIRNGGEIETLRKMGDFRLIAVAAPSKLRYDRAVEQRAESDVGSFEDFRAQEFQELTSKDPHKQDLSGCVIEADYLIGNEGSVEELEEKFVGGEVGFLNLLGESKRRISFHERYMGTAFSASYRSTCRRRRTGAAITKNNALISDGYNGAPSGAPHCLDLGCLREQLDIPSGEREELCRGVHAEANAILNAPTKESRKGSIMYATNYPCNPCAKLISNAGPIEVVHLAHYNSPNTDRVFKESGIKTRFHTGVTPMAIDNFWAPGVK